MRPSETNGGPGRLCLTEGDRSTRKVLARTVADVYERLPLFAKHLQIERELVAAVTSEYAPGAAHNPKVAGSNPAPATKPSRAPVRAPFLCLDARRASGHHRSRKRSSEIRRVKHEGGQASRRGVLRHVPARLRRHGRCRPGGLARGHRQRSRRRSAGLRPHGRDHGLRGRAHLRRPTSTPPSRSARGSAAASRGARSSSTSPPRSTAPSPRRPCCT